MKAFVAGAIGVLGRRAVARLVAAGVEVTGVARNAERAARLEELGATPAPPRADAGLGPRRAG